MTDQVLPTEAIVVPSEQVETAEIDVPNLHLSVDSPKRKAPEPSEGGDDNASEGKKAKADEHVKDSEVVKPNDSQKVQPAAVEVPPIELPPHRESPGVPEVVPASPDIAPAAADHSNTHVQENASGLSSPVGSAQDHFKVPKTPSKSPEWVESTPNISPNSEFPSFGSGLSSAYVPTPPPSKIGLLDNAPALEYEAKIQSLINKYEEKLLENSREATKKICEASAKLEEYRAAVDRRNKENEILKSQLHVATGVGVEYKAPPRTEALQLELAGQDRTLLDLALNLAQMNNNLMRFLSDMRKQYASAAHASGRK